VRASTPAFAEETVAAAAKPPTQADLIFRKLGRGIANVGTCPLELLRIPEQVGRRDGYLSGMTVGLLQGLWGGVLRGVAGVFEIATFYAELPKDYGPLVHPEFIFAHGSWVE
jgi:putative exosortase-associated protein (TIGR04073 family)